MKFRTISIALLFIFIALSPLVYGGLGKDEKYIEFQIDFYGLDQTYKIKLNYENTEKLKELFEEYKNRFSHLKSYEEGIILFREFIKELKGIGLLVNQSINQVENLILRNFSGKKIFNEEYEKQNNFDNKTNALCLILGESTQSILFSSSLTDLIFACWIIRSRLGLYPLLPEIINYLINILFDIGLDNLASLFAIISSIPSNIRLFIWLSLILSANYINPIPIFYSIGYGNQWSPSKGYIHSLGLNGFKSWEGNFYGHLPLEPIGFLFGGYAYRGVSGFTGIKIYSEEPFSQFYFGSALFLKINSVNSNIN